MLSLENIWPLYGPVAGGTRVTIIGHYLNADTIRAVYFGVYKRYLDTNRLSFPFIPMILGRICMI